MSVNEKDCELAIRQIEDRLAAKYGELISLDELAEILSYPTSGALRKAYYNGKAPINLFKVKNRKGIYALVKDVAMYLNSLSMTEK